MATIAFAAIAAYLVPAAEYGATAAFVAGAAATAAGAYIDNAYTYPALSGKPQGTVGPKIDDRSVQVASEGSDLKFALGAENRFAGVVIWASDLIEQKVETNVSGGKGGGGGGHNTNYEYYVHVAVALTDQQGFLPVNAIHKIWADSKLIYDDSVSTPLNFNASIHNFREEVGTDLPYAWMRFDSGPPTDAENSVTANFNGAVTVDEPSLIYGNAGKTYKFIATGFVEITSAPLIRMPDWTIEWLMKSTYVGATWVNIEGEGGGTSGIEQIDIQVQGSTGKIRLLYKDAAGVTTTITSVGTTYCDGAVHHVAIVVAGLAVTIYKDGVVDTTGTLPAAPSPLQNDTDAVARIGANYAGATQLDLTWIDEVSYYRRDLAANRIEAHADAALGVAVSTAKGQTPGLDTRVHKLRIYRGYGLNQNPDPLIESFQGVGNVPAFRDICYFVIEALWLRDWGNRVPQFTALVEVQSHESVAASIYNLLHRSGFADNEIDVNKVLHSIRGIQISGPTSGQQAIEPLLQAYDVFSQERGGVFYFFSRGYEDKDTVLAADLCSAQFKDNSKPPRPFLVTDTNGFDLPRVVQVRYIDPTNDYQAGSQTYTANSKVGTTTQIDYDLPLVMSPVDARNFAATQLWRIYQERTPIEINLPPRYLHIYENDLLNIPWQGEVYTIRVDEVNRGANFLINIKGPIVATQLASEVVECSARLNIAEEVSNPSPPILMALDIPALRDSDVSTPGLYTAAAAGLFIPRFMGAAVYYSADNVSYSLWDSFTTEAKMGSVQSTTVLFEGPTNVPDQLNYIDVLVFEGTLSGISEDELAAGGNICIVGQEIIAFRDATLIGPKTYRLSYLLRGLRGTYLDKYEFQAKRHFDTAERVLFIDNNAVKFEPLNISAIGSTRYLRAVSTGMDYTEVPALLVNFTGATLKQLPPCQFAYTYPVSGGGSGDCVVTWVRVTRALTSTFSPDKPLLALVEKYDIEFYQDTGSDTPGTLFRTYTVTSPTATYSRADQITDGVSLGQSFYIKVYQWNEQVGRGFPAERILVAT